MIVSHILSIHPHHRSEDGNFKYEITCGANIVLTKDTLILFNEKTFFGGDKGSNVFGLWLNTQFVVQNYLKVTKKELDKVNKKAKLPDFEVEFFFESTDPAAEAAYEEALAQPARASLSDAGIRVVSWCCV